MNFKLVTLLGVKIDQEVYEVIIPTPEGEIAVYPSHEHLVSLAVPGAITIRYSKDDSDDKLEHLAISGGVVEILHKSVKVLVDEAIHSDEIIEAESQAALDRAIELRKNAANQIELDKAYQMVDRHQVRLKVAQLRRRHRS
ncbi:ATP synthase F1 subunit epsilon [Candidatus Saccharibacteria bacterium CG11_big_fil_rev_8_21_14_0_20_41_19]|nr:ATP synthase F1 subunit epsilon [Candidatus Saccharibacteria bacterium]OIP85833.1 MAG: ATP synthase F1 subunit epsilon [Candidatus Saccharibacteria bacterium CG2_30_41_52]PIQ70949.1 MAG: ATP synthase F1 subunit epsilon [Candidatus Saccharibacteria bacterium CG11_big_fil_rev_8_21_14_0_20_41_19]PIZ60751.1 MAG: ATP synthase F1 subunit epsilon [Candidatus Saccharibacteria bacterium CG_4_10_14_0_2_um_filter_41_11]PJC29405.1 MAG: ATP synthase F1 subunit epsilon [Candidatus Saccharibacteria bacteri